MPTTAAPSQRPFFWQVALILLPVLVLAVLGIASLRQDRALALAEARERAQQIAGGVEREVMWALNAVVPATQPYYSATGGDFSVFVTNFWRAPEPPAPDRDPVLRHAQLPEPMQVALLETNGHLLYPPPRASLPKPQPLDLASLPPDLLQLWQRAEDDSSGREHSNTQQAGAWRAVLAEAFRPAFRARALFALALATAENNPAEARNGLTELMEKFPGERSASGLPLGPLAAARLASSDFVSTSDAPATAVATQLAAQAVLHPSLLTDSLLARASKRATINNTGSGSPTVDQWRRVWETHEQSRRLHALALPWLEPRAARENRSFAWVEADGLWLAWRVRLGDSGRDLLLARREERVRQAIAEILAGRPQIEAVRIPPYLGVAVRFAERDLVRATGESTLLARVDSEIGDTHSPNTAVRLLPDGGRVRMIIEVFLSHPAALYARQRQRTLWFGGVIVLACVTAVIGLVTTRRAFLRQLRLGELKSNFVSSVSHELRAPIASVRLMAESLESGRVREEPRRAEYFKLIVQECRRLTALIENALDFARIEQGRKQFEFDPIDPVALVGQTLTLMQPSAQERGVRLAEETRPTPFALNGCQFLADGRAVQQALVNLIDNAIKHAPAGSIVTIALGAKPGAGASVLTLAVRDDGPGIPASEHARIFERFYRLGSELRRETPGVGIGLSIVKHIVEAHGGRVQVESVPGQGSWFTMEFPLAPGESGDGTRRARHWGVQF